MKLLKILIAVYFVLRWNDNFVWDPPDLPAFYIPRETENGEIVYDDTSANWFPTKEREEKSRNEDVIRLKYERFPPELRKAMNMKMYRVEEKEIQ